VVNPPFASRGFRLGLRPQEGKIEVVKQIEDVIISYPYSLASDTLQRLTFHVSAILSNKDSILVFEEPESHSFPLYIKHLAELIALDQNGNQYFISTHNPYFFLPTLAKTPKDELSVHIIYYKNYETKAKLLTEKDIEELDGVDIFSNLDRYLEGE
jgi:AAA15 family ATPase/GTPase